LRFKSSFRLSQATYTLACTWLGLELSLLGNVARVGSLGVSRSCHGQNLQCK